MIWVKDLHEIKLGVNLLLPTHTIEKLSLVNYCTKKGHKNNLNTTLSTVGAKEAGYKYYFSTCHRVEKVCSNRVNNCEEVKVVV